MGHESGGSYGPGNRWRIGFSTSLQKWVDDAGKPKTVADARALARIVIDRTSEYLGIKPDGEPYFGDHSMLRLSFGHIGHKATNRPTGVAKNLDTITVLKAMISIDPDGWVVAERPLRDSKIRWVAKD